MSERKYDQSLCRLRKVLRSEQGGVIDKVTIGSGCLVFLKSEGEESLNLITTTQVVNKNYLLSESSHGTPIKVEFLEGRSGKPLSMDLNFNYKDAADSISDPIPGRAMPDSEELEEGTQQVSFIVIPVKKFDSRSWFKRRWNPLSKRSIPFSCETDENLRTAISNRQVLCYVICDDRKSDGFYIAEPSCITFDKDGEFVLASTSDDDSIDNPKTIKDLPTEQKPKGGILLNGAGQFVGMLAVSRSGKRKLFPVFLPNLDKESTHTLRKDEWNSAYASCSKYESATNEITVKSEETSKVSDEAMPVQGNRQGNRNENNGISRKNQASANNSKSESTEGGNPTTVCAEGQGSSNPAGLSLMSDDCLPDAQSNLNDQKQQGQLPPLGENPDDGSEQVELHDDLQESSESDNPPATNPRCNYSSDQSSESSASDGDDPEEKYSSINENAHDYQQSQNLYSQGSSRPGLLTQHSHHDPPVLTGSSSFPDEVSKLQTPHFVVANNLDLRNPTSVSDPTPKRHDDTSFTLTRGDDPGASSGIPRSQSDAVFSSSGETRQAPKSPRTYHHSIKVVERFKPGSYVKDKIVSKAIIMDMICLHLDRSVSPSVQVAALIRQRWEHLADEFKVPDDVKRRCVTYTGNSSPSEAMFGYLRTTHGSLEIGTIKRYLRELGRNDVIEELEKNKDLFGDVTVVFLCERCPETLSNICIQLDDKRFVKNWHDLGLKIGLNGRQLGKLQEPSEDSPADVVLNMIYTLEPDLLLTDMKDELRELNLDAGIHGAIANALVHFEAESTIKTLLDDSDALEEVAALLDYKRGWFRVGRKYGMSKIQLDSLTPKCPESPTKLLMEYIVANDPHLNMTRFLEALANIKRHDIINELKEFFHAKDIDDIAPRALPRRK